MKLIIIAMIIDFFIGDPVYALHPIRIMGSFISFFEKRLLKHDLSDKEKFMRGVFVVHFNVLFVIFLYNFILWIIPTNFLKDLFKIYILYSSISLNELGKSSNRVYKALFDSIEKARYKLSMIVGRDTMNLEEVAIIRAGVETVAENTSDGVIAPLFYAFLFGPCGAIVLKMVNTMDSMIGYINEKYEYFGKLAAIVDDLFMFIPSRITALLFLIVSILIGENTKNTISVILRDSKKHKSINAGYPECAMTGVLGVKLLGPSYYNGVLSDKPFVGNEIRKIEREDIIRANRIMYFASYLFLFFGIIFMSYWR